LQQLGWLAMALISGQGYALKIRLCLYTKKNNPDDLNLRGTLR
jgi:hypothetical protein